MKGLGETLPELKEKLSDPALEKMTFSCCGDSAFLDKLRRHWKRSQVIITGMETHVCVLQTVLELLDAGYTVHLVRDAVMSRRKENWFVGAGDGSRGRCGHHLHRNGAVPVAAGWPVPRSSRSCRSW